MSFSLLNFQQEPQMDFYAKKTPQNNQAIGLNPTTKESISDDSMSFYDSDEKIRNLSIKPFRSIKRKKHVFDGDLKFLDLISKEIHIEFNEESQKSIIKKDENYNKEILLPKKSTQKKSKWTCEENEIFYKAIAIFGTDFSLIQTCLPTKTRKEIKNKFQLEEKKGNKRFLNVLNVPKKNTNLKKNDSKFVDLEKILSGDIKKEISINDFDLLNGTEILKEKLSQILEIENNSRKDCEFLFAS